MTLLFGAWLGLVLAMGGLGFSDPLYWALLVGGAFFFNFLESK